MSGNVLETERLRLREMTQSDLPDLSEILQDAEVMYAYEHAFDDGEVKKWLAKNVARYLFDGFGLWAVIDKQSGEFLGQCGITMQKVGDEFLHEIGYLFKRKHWHNGYATEAALGCIKFAREVLNITAVYSIIRDSNTASRAVAERVGMTEWGSEVRHYYGMDMPHIIYRLEL